MKKFFRNEVLETSLYHVDAQPGIRLNQNESPWDVPLDLKVAITERLIKIDWNRYPTKDDTTPIYEKLAEGLGISTDQLVLSNGANTIIQAIINLSPVGSKIVLLDPSCGFYEHQAMLHGNKIIKVPLSEEFELLTEKTLATIKKERPTLVLIGNPNSPTGTLFDKKSLHRIIQTSPCPVVIDESYFYFTAETVLEWLSEFDNLIILRSLSKAMSLAGIRFGFAISQAHNCQLLEKFLAPNRLSRITCAIVDEVFKSHHYVYENAETLVVERGRMFSKMQTIEGVRVFPSEANFLLFRMDKAHEVARLLQNDGFLIRNVDNQTSLINCLRVTIGSPEQNDAFLLTLKKVKNEVKDL